MNLVGNTCVASYITKFILKEKFTNPFIWNIIKFDSCYNLVKYWDEINFDNYVLTKDAKNNYMLFIDGKVKIRYVHYKFDSKCTKPTRKNSDIFYNKIKEYIIQKYLVRLKRMRENKEKPIFIFVKPNCGSPHSSNQGWTLEQQKKMEALDTPYKIIISFKEMIKSDKLITVKQTRNFKNNGLNFATFIYENALLKGEIDIEEKCKIFKEPLKLWFKRITGKNCNVDNPTTFTDKIQWLKIYDCIPLKTVCADKIKIHEYVKEKLNKDICVPIIRTYDSTETINFDELPDKFVIKCNHGSGMTIIVKDKSKTNFEEIKNKLNKWLNLDYSMKFGYEFHYKNIPHKILVEEYKENEGNLDLIDYKFYCFNGNPVFCQVITDRHNSEKLSHYDMEWNYKPEYDRVGFNSDSNIQKPKNYDEMIEYAKILSNDFKFVRVDFYEVDGIVYLGELTFTPLSGTQKFKNPNIDKQLGNLLKL